MNNLSGMASDCSYIKQILIADYLLLLQPFIILPDLGFNGVGEIS